MKKYILSIILSAFLIHTGFSQKVEHIKGGTFSKKTGYNIIAPGKRVQDRLYNLSDKSVLERVLFGTTNSFVEYVFKGSSEGVNEVLALRIVNNEETDSYQLEIMRLPKMEDVYKMEKDLSAETSEINIPGKLQSLLTPESREKISEHNKNAHYASFRSDEPYKNYRPEPQTFGISKKLAEKLHNKIESLIKNFTGKGIQASVTDGYTMIYRCVAGDEVQALTVQCPQSGALRLSDACLEIINTYKDKTDESQYIKLLDEIDL